MTNEWDMSSSGDGRSGEARSSCTARNNAGRERLRALAARLSDEDLACSIGHGWTSSAALAHLAFWDLRVLGLLENWERTGARPASSNFDSVNDAMLGEWLAMGPREAAQRAVAAAEAVDGKIETLAPALVEEMVAAGYVRLVDRSIHRREHLGEIEGAL